MAPPCCTVEFTLIAPGGCPLCLQQENDDLRQALTTAIADRDAAHKQLIETNVELVAARSLALSHGQRLGAALSLASNALISIQQRAQNARETLGRI